MEQPDFQSIAAQLRNPQGEDGIKTAIRMSENNAFMITSGIDSLGLKANDNVLEMGPGGGLHIPYLFQKEKDIQYYGVDISATMIEMAKENNQVLIEDGKADLYLATIENGYCKLSFNENYFDKILTVNTLYFWDNAITQAKELLKVLKPSGQVSIVFATADFMEQLPFTKYNFKLYSLEEAVQLFEGAGFKNMEIMQQKEWIENTVNGTIERAFHILTATKI